jgi:hypothetical protein
MIVRTFTAAPPPDVAAALARFEEQFVYPLGPGRSFRISHGGDYPRFFRAMGDAACFIAERDGTVLGVLGLAVVPLHTPERVRSAIYLGALKIAPAARGGRVLYRLAEASRAWWARADCAFAVVMDGTRVTPETYTGRLGIPQFREAAKVAILRLPATDDPTRVAAWRTGAAAGPGLFAILAADRVHTDGGSPAERSEGAAAWLVAPGGAACGRLEDTRRAKRLIADSGAEMVSAHLSCIGYRRPADLAELLRVARAAAGAAGFPAVFAAVPPEHAALGGADAVVAPATVFATGIEPNLLWAVNTAEV